MATALVLRDVTATITLMGNDDGTFGTAVGSALTLCLDQLTINEMWETVEASCKQSSTKKNRITQNDWTMNIETILDIDGTFLVTLQSDDAALVRIIITYNGITITADGLVKSLNKSFDNPSKLTMEIASYGVAITYAD